MSDDRRQDLLRSLAAYGADLSRGPADRAGEAKQAKSCELGNLVVGRTKSAAPQEMLEFGFPLPCLASHNRCSRGRNSTRP